ncbi:MAG: DUF192 domain-containing protein [Pseudomonadota bacterium]
MHAAIRFCAIALIGAVPHGLWASCSSDQLRIDTGRDVVTFDIELALTPAERNRGLMFRESMAMDAGMLFIFDPPRQVAFWMRNTLIPLDMIFIDRQGVVEKVHANAIPHDETGIPSDGPVYGVLEINGNLSAGLGIEPGSRIQHDLFGPNAAWPC